MNIIVKNSVKTGIFFLFCLLISVNTAQPMFTARKPKSMWPEHPKKEFLVDRSGHPDLHGDAIYRKYIFQWLTGYTENDFVSHYKTAGSLPKLPQTTQILINNIQPETLTLAQLRKSIEGKLTHNNGTLSILYLDVMKHPEKREFIDIGALQAKNPGAVFQTASRPNGLEGRQMIYQANKDKTKSENAFNYTRNGFTEILGAGAVQGEEAAISAAMKAIYQIYMVDKNINFFEKIEIQVNPRGRIVHIDSAFLTKTDEDSLSDRICVRFLPKVPVTTGYSNVINQSNTIAEGAKKELPFNSKLRSYNREDANMIVTEPCFISQVNVSAVDLSKDKKTECIKGFEKNYILAEKTAKAALKAAYEAPLYCAIEEKKTKVFLTLVGCGAFQNKLEWIAQILDKLTPIIKQSGLDITLVAMDANGHLAVTQKEAWDKIKEIATKTGGKITDVVQTDTPVKPVTSTITSVFTEVTPSTNAIVTNDNSFKFLTIRNMLCGGLGIVGILLAYKYYFQSTTATK